MILKLNGGVATMAITMGEVKVEINYAREMMTHLMHCKTEANELLKDKLKETVTDGLDRLICELQDEMRKMERDLNLHLNLVA
jgi:hypothetical protein